MLPRLLGRGAATALVATFWWTGPAGALAHSLLELSPQHVVTKPAAKLDPALKTSIIEGMKGRSIKTAADVVAYSLERSRAQLHFGMAHKTSLQFSAKEREANCIEYAHFFAQVAAVVAKEANVELSARVVRSRASVAGKAIPLAGWDTHDWVLIRAGEQRLLIDPSFDDAGLGAELEGVVVSPPR
jgi:hypothetical protein